jgi:hypothetical protein
VLHEIPKKMDNAKITVNVEDEGLLIVTVVTGDLPVLCYRSFGNVVEVELTDQFLKFSTRAGVQ